jgi:hypothetical protein
MTLISSGARREGIVYLPCMDDSGYPAQDAQANVDPKILKNNTSGDIYRL